MRKFQETLMATLREYTQFFPTLSDYCGDFFSPADSLLKEGFFSEAAGSGSIFQYAWIQEKEITHSSHLQVKVSYQIERFLAE